LTVLREIYLLVLVWTDIDPLDIVVLVNVLQPDPVIWQLDDPQLSDRRINEVEEAIHAVLALEALDVIVDLTALDPHGDRLSRMT
jgi:hypothetical protein